GILSAADRTAANAVLRRWVQGLGELDDCSRCARLDESGLYLKPDLDWLSDNTRLGAELSRDLQRIFRNRPAGGTQFYISLAPNVRNPVFDHEPAYPGVRL